MRLVLLALAFSACSYRADRECVSERGCPDPAPLPRCAAEPPSTLPRHALTPDHLPPLDRDVLIEGRLVMGQGACTLLLCPNDCCNGCGAAMRIVDPTTVVGVDLAGGGGDRWTCGGDESGLCCRAPVDVPVLAEGRFLLTGESIYGPVYTFRAGRVCQLDAEPAR